MTRDYMALARRYAEAVVAGEVPAGSWTIKACQRSLNDHGRASTPAFPYRFDDRRATKACAFVEQLTHVKGVLAGQFIRLAEWQAWVLSEAFGWTHDGGTRDGLRRFRKVYLELGRGCGKSCLSSCVGLLMLAADNQAGGEVYSSATTQSQARIVFDDAQAMARSPQSSRLMRTLGVDVHAHSITVPSKNSKFIPLSAEGSTLDGLNISGCIVDELHAHKTRAVWDVLETGAGKRPESLIWSITTAGSDTSGICYEQRSYLTKLLDGIAEDPTVFGCIWCADADADWRDPQAWACALPNLGVSVDVSYIEAQAAKCEAMPAAQNNFRTKYLCQWVNAKAAWMDMRYWDRCADPDLRIEDFAGKPCFIALDLATKIDLAAKCYLFPEQRGDETHYTMFAQAYLPEAAVRDGRNSQYSGWEITGHLRVTEGNVLDFGRIEDDLMEDHRRFQVKDCAVDPWQAQQLCVRMAQMGVTLTEYRNTVANMSEPMKTLDSWLRSGKLHHDGNPVARWCASNVVATLDAKDNIFPNKERAENKIDIIVAAIMCTGRALVHEDTASVYTGRGLLVWG